MSKIRFLNGGHLEIQDGRHRGISKIIFFKLANPKLKKTCSVLLPIMFSSRVISKSRFLNGGHLEIQDGHHVTDFQQEPVNLIDAYLQQIW